MPNHLLPLSSRVQSRFTDELEVYFTEATDVTVRHLLITIGSRHVTNYYLSRSSSSEILHSESYTQVLYHLLSTQRVPFPSCCLSLDHILL